MQIQILWSASKFVSILDIFTRKFQIKYTVAAQEKKK